MSPEDIQALTDAVDAATCRWDDEIDEAYIRPEYSKSGHERYLRIRDENLSRIRAADQALANLRRELG